MSRPPPPKRLYRFFEQESHAESFVSGHIHLSTLGYLRTCQRTRGDPDEASATYSSGLAWWHNGKKNTAARNVEALGIFKFAPNAQACVMYDNDFNFKTDDAWLLCTTLSNKNRWLKSSFGKHCIEINDPFTFFNVLTDALEKVAPVQDSKFAPVKYVGRHLSAENAAMGDVAFIGPANHAWEKEARMLWRPISGYAIEPFRTYVSGLSRLCRLL